MKKDNTSIIVASIIGGVTAVVFGKALPYLSKKAKSEYDKFKEKHPLDADELSEEVRELHESMSSDQSASTKVSLDDDAGYLDDDEEYDPREVRDASLVEAPVYTPLTTAEDTLRQLNVAKSVAPSEPTEEIEEI